MRLARIAALVVSVPTVSDGQSPIVRGDSVRITVAGQPPTVGRVATVAGDTIRLDDGTQYRLADVGQVEVGRSGVDRQRQVVLAIVGGALGIVAAQLIPTNPDAFLNPTPALTAGGALAGMWLARRRVETQWHVAGVARDADPPRAVAADPPIQAARARVSGSGWTRCDSWVRSPASTNSLSTCVRSHQSRSDRSTSSSGASIRRHAWPWLAACSLVLWALSSPGSTAQSVAAATISAPSSA
jgi:hypothetical protein